MNKKNTPKKSKTKKWQALVLLALILILIKSADDFSKSPKQSTNQTPTSTVHQTGDKIELENGVVVNDFNQFAISIGKLNEVLFIQKPLYNATYYPLDKAFLIVITSYPFQDNRLKAEEDFLSVLGIDKSQACNLTVYITTPRIYNPNEAGINHTLSFCH